MSLAVAGLKAEELQQRTRKLSSGDWTAFSPAERLAFGLGSKLTTAPATVTAAEVGVLRDTLGQQRALDVIFYIAWGNYMTRVGDAFQLPLERENPFIPPTTRPAQKTR